MVWIVVVAVIAIVFWMHYSQAMSVSDRVSVALDIIRSSNFSPAEGFQEAVQEDPDLVGWAKTGNHCVMLFRHEQEGGDVQEVVDFASDSFHPALVIHYVNAKPVKTDSGEIADSRPSNDAAELLQHVRKTVCAKKRKLEYDGCHY